MTSVMSYTPLPPPPADLPPPPSSEMAHHHEPSSSPWLATSQLPYQDAYMTPAYSTYSASGDARFSAHSQDDATHNHPLSADRSPWAESSFSRPPPPEYLGSFTLPAPPLHVLPSNLHNRPLSAFGERPKSSPSTFGPTAHTVNWPDPREFKPSTYSHYPEPPMLHSSFQPSVPFQPVLGTELASPSPPPHLTMHHPQPSRRYAALAPSPGKRSHDDDTMGYNSEDAGAPASAATNKRRKRTCSVASADLSEDDKLLVSLKEDEALPWKDIAARFGEHHGKTFQVAALQMRYKRLREKFRVWQSEDVEALKLASEYYEKYKWDIISSKMLDFGVQERWPSKHCARKWQKISPMQPSPQLIGTPQQHHNSLPPPQLHSPAQSPEFAYMPAQTT